jgi:hypothetical protein
MISVIELLCLIVFELEDERLDVAAVALPLLNSLFCIRIEPSFVFILACLHT